MYVNITSPEGKKTRIKQSSMVSPNNFLKDLHRKNKVWDIDYKTIKKDREAEWLGTDIYWRVRRALEKGKSIVCQESIYRVKDHHNPVDLQEKLKDVIDHMRRIDEKLWLNEEDPDCVTLIIVS